MYGHVVLSCVDVVVRECGVGNPRWICDVMLQCMLVGEVLYGECDVW